MFGWFFKGRNAVFVESKKQNKVIFTEAVPAVSQCARSKSASRADVLHAADETHPPASKRETTPCFIIIHINRPHKVWLPDEEGEYTVCFCRCVMPLYMCVRSACARENTALYSQKPGFWLLQNFFSFFIRKQRQERRRPQKNNSRNYDNKKRQVFKNCFRRLHLKIWKRAALKILILLCVYVSNVQSAALKWSDLRYKWQPDMQRDTERNIRILSAERTMAIMYIMGLSFLAACLITHHPETKWHAMWRLLSEVTIVAVWHFSLLLSCIWQSFTQKK